MSLLSEENKTLIHTIVTKTIPFCLLVIVCAVGGIVLYEVELAIGEPKNNVFRNETETCILHGDYWSTIVFVNGLTVAVGIGSHMPCTGWGKALTVLYSIIGIPLALIVLNQVGQLMSESCSYCYIKIYQFHWNSGMRRKKKRSADVALEPLTNETTQTLLEDDAFRFPPDNRITTPLWFVGIICAGWILMCGLIFALSCDWDYGNGTFFTFFILTWGSLADITSYGYWVSAFTIVTLFVGLSLVSNLVNTVQSNIDKTVTQMEEQLDEEMKELIANDTPMDAKSKTSGFMSNLIPKKHMENLNKQRLKASSMRNSSTQTYVETFEQSIQSTPMVNEQSMQATEETGTE